MVIFEIVLVRLWLVICRLFIRLLIESGGIGVFEFGVVFGIVDLFVGNGSLRWLML